MCTVFSALEIFLLMRYINWRFTYILTYLFTSVTHDFLASIFFRVFVQIRRLCNVLYRKFDYARYPGHVRNLYTYAFKPIVIHVSLCLLFVRAVSSLKVLSFCRALDYWCRVVVLVALFIKHSCKLSKARFPLPELTGDRFPLPVRRQHGPCTRLVETRARQHSPC